MAVRFRVHLKADMGIRLPEDECQFQWIFRDVEYSINMRTRYQLVGGAQVPVGLEFIADLQASQLSASEAMQQAGGSCDAILSLLTLLSGMPAPAIVPYLAYDVTEGVRRRRIRQVKQLDIRLPRFRTIRKEELTSLHEAWSRMLPDNTAGWRIGHAMVAYRRSLLENEPIGEFLQLWFGLEALNPLLQERLNSQPESMRCRRCGYEIKRPATTGIRDYMSHALPDGREIYKRMRDLRVALVHQTQPWAAIGDLLAQLVPHARKALLSAIAELLDTDPAGWLSFQKDKVGTRPFQLVIEAETEPCSVSQFMPDARTPHFEVEVNLQDAEVVPPGDRIKLKIRSQVTSRVAVRVDHIELELWGPEGYELN